MFDEVTKKEGGKRAVRRSAWIAGSTAVQAAAVAGMIAFSAALAKNVSEGPLVPVKIIKAATPTPPKPPPPPPAPKKKAATPQKPKSEAKPRPAMIQPKEMPEELKPPDTSPPEEEDYGDEGSEGGVIGGVVGGVVGGAPAPPAPPQPAGPVKFNQNVMAPPQLVSGPPLEYTQQALEREIEGTMVVECVVTVDGKVHACQVLKGLPYMDRAVVQNLEQRRYRPATLGGKPLDVQYTFTIRLKLPQ